MNFLAVEQVVRWWLERKCRIHEGYLERDLTQKMQLILPPPRVPNKYFLFTFTCNLEKVHQNWGLNEIDTNGFLGFLEWKWLLLFEPKSNDKMQLYEKGEMIYLSVIKFTWSFYCSCKSNYFIYKIEDVFFFGSKSIKDWSLVHRSIIIIFIFGDQNSNSWYYFR